MQNFRFADIHKLASTIIIGTKKDAAGKDTKAWSMHQLIKMVHPVSIHLMIDPAPREGPPPDEASFTTMKKLFDYVLIYPDCERIVFEKTMGYIGIADFDAKITEFHAKEPGLPMVICLNRMKPGVAIEIKAMIA
jgi:hypothetical protein